jgi:hypothetical protein
MKFYTTFFIQLLLFFSFISCNGIIKNNEEAQTVEINRDEGKLTREKAKDILLKSQKIPEYLVSYFCLSENAHLNRTYPNDFVLKDFYREYVSSGLFEECTPDRWVGRECKFSSEGKKYVATGRVNKPSGYFINDYRNWPHSGGEINYCWGGGTQLVGVKVGTLQFGEITGITENNYSGQNSATVEYRLVLSDITPFGEHLPSGGSIRDRFGQGNMRATFVKYDDGWRIKN